MAEHLPAAVTLTVRGPIDRSTLPALASRACALFTANRGCRVHCDVSDLRVDVVTVEALARLQLAARRTDCVVVIRSASTELHELVSLMGLTEVLPEQP